MGNRISNYRLRRALRNQDFQQVPRFTFKGITTLAKVVSVYDGDTVTVGFKWCGTYIKKSFRLYGIDTPELRPAKTDPQYQLHRQAGLMVAGWVGEQLLNQIVWIQFTKEDKYGRLMGCIYPTDQLDYNPPPLSEIMSRSFNQLLINKGFALEYGGGTKQEFTADFLNYIVDSLTVSEP